MEDYRTYIKNTTQQRLIGTVLFLVLLVSFFILGATVNTMAQYQSQNNDFAVNFED